LHDPGVAIIARFEFGVTPAKKVKGFSHRVSTRKTVRRVKQKPFDENTFIEGFSFLVGLSKRGRFEKATTFELNKFR
jgi:hypothetical protein